MATMMTISSPIIQTEDESVRKIAKTATTTSNVSFGKDNHKQHRQSTTSRGGPTINNTATTIDDHSVSSKSHDKKDGI